ncbi:hypothetical protein [Streptomyces catenulae]|uniref:Uncharacterized protein n=1 Tax=Streptomyces catenulae TaxID=66875 RepID=A0ABV2Z5H9_9ACTN|nr:hypothetical protein [Streptomyces catenulae]
MSDSLHHDIKGVPSPSPAPAPAPFPAPEPVSRALALRSGSSGMVYASIRALHTSYAALETLDEENRGRVLRWLIEALDVSVPDLSGATGYAADGALISPSGATPQTSRPRDFISSKKPQSLVERMACLGYYLSHYRDTPHFRIQEIVQLNTEAASQKFGNPSRDFDNADRQNGYLVSAGIGLKQITPRGEAVVEALPDRDAVKQALRNNPFKSRRSRDSSRRAKPQGKDEE